MTDCQEELVSFIKDILCSIRKDIGPALKQVVQLAEIEYRDYCRPSINSLEDRLAH